MADNSYLETPEKIFRVFPHFCVGEKNSSRIFSNRHEQYKGGVPLAYDSRRNIIAVDPTDTHTLIWGSTGSLKTRCVIEPSVKIIGKSGESMIINDPKAEIYSRCAAELKADGYEVVVINIRDPELGNSWNPLAIPYQFWRAGDYDRAAEFANDIASNLMLEEKSEKDVFWDYSAADVLFGLEILLFRYATDHNLDSTAINMSALTELRRQLFKNGSAAKNSPLWKYAVEDELIAARLSGSIYAPNDTMHSILSVFDQKMGAFTIRPALLDMLSNNDIDIGSISEKKVAVFLVIPDEKSTYNNLVSLFVKQSYEYLIYLASGNENHKLHNRVNFILDEFSSLPPISSMSTLISAARSRDVRFILAVQGKHQLIKRYGDEAETIKSNCANWIYLMSRELDLLREISELCGEQRSRLPNISVYDLQHFSKENREALVLCGRLKPAKVNLLDIDWFGEEKYTVLDFEKLPRKERYSVKFELSKEIMERVAPLQSSNPFREPFGFSDRNPIPSGITEHPTQSDTVLDSLNTQELIDKIDAKIAELEREEQEEARLENIDPVLAELDTVIEDLKQEEGYFEVDISVDEETERQD